VAGAIAGGFLAYRTGEPAEAVRPAGEPTASPGARPALPAAPVRPEPLAPVVFEVRSEPPGATVSTGGVVVGTTPLRFSQPRDGAGPARAELAFALDGYQDASLVVQGLDSPVPVTQALRRRSAVAGPTAPTRPAPARPKKPVRGGAEAPAGYKDDPYQ